MSETREIPLVLIVRSPFNRDRSKEAGTEQWKEFVESIRQHGILQEITVRPLPGALDPDDWPDRTRYELVIGEGRWLGAAAAGLKTIPAKVRQLSDLEVLELQTIENDKRKNLDPIEQAQKYRQIVDEFQRTGGAPVDAAVAKTAAVIKKSKSAVYEALRLLELTDRVKDAVHSGALSASQAGLVVQVEGDPHIRQRTVNRVVDYVLETQPSFRQTKEFIDKVTGRKPRLRVKPADPAAKFHAVAGDLYPHLCNHCRRIFQSFAKGKTPKLRASGGRKL